MREEDVETARIGTQLEIDAAARTNPGKVRKNNEDHHLVAKLARSLEVVATNLPDGDLPATFGSAGWIFVVADGMGGAEAGEVASRIAIEAGLVSHLSRSSWYLRADEAETGRVLERMRELLDQVHAAVSRAAASDAGLAGMGTTLTAAYATGANLFLAHVGDSRAYLMRKGELHQISRDQTLVQELVDQGSIQPEAAANHPLRHVLTHAVGSEKVERLPAQLEHFQLQDGDRLLLCTDGLTDPLDAQRIAAILGGAADPRAACEGLIAGALDGGAPDNVTVIAAFCRLTRSPLP
jgi:protein phosphatase